MSDPSRDVASHLALALDYDDVVEATRVAQQLRPWFSIAKVGLELFCAAGSDAVVSMGDAGFKVFLDVKLHDIPTTVGRAARVLGALGTSYLTLHAAGGEAMLRAGVEGLADGAASVDLDPPVALAVTVLTSEPVVDPAILHERLDAAVAAGCGGVVCSASDLAEVRRRAPSLRTFVPGIRLDGPAHDQARVSRPGEALAAGADVLVIGRAVTHAGDLKVAAQAIHDAATGLPR